MPRVLEKTLVFTLSQLMLLQDNITLLLEVTPAE